MPREVFTSTYAKMIPVVQKIQVINKKKIFFIFLLFIIYSIYCFYKKKPD